MRTTKVLLFILAAVGAFGLHRFALNNMLDIGLVQAVLSRDQKEAIRLLKLGADPNLSVHMQANYRWVSKASPGVGGKGYRKSLFEESIDSDMPLVAAELINSGARNIPEQLTHPDNHFGGGGMTLMLWAAGAKCPPLIEASLKLRHDPNHIGYRGRSPILDAAQAGHQESVDLLLANGANPRYAGDDGFNLLMAASESGNLELVKKALSFGIDPNLEVVSGTNALESAAWARQNRSKVIHILLTHGADPRIGSKSGSPALTNVTCNGDLESVKLLVEHGADVNVTRMGTPLLSAIEEQSIPISRYLLEHGANPNLAFEGQTPYETAVRLGNREVMDLLIKYGAKPTKSKKMKRLP